MTQTESVREPLSGIRIGFGLPAAPLPLPSPESHIPLSVVNDTGHGIRSLYVCSCGERPKKGSSRGSTMHVWHDNHRRKLGLEKFDIVWDQTVYGPGSVAEGLTWRQWREMWPTFDPYTGDPDSY